MTLATERIEILEAKVKELERLVDLANINETLQQILTTLENIETNQRDPRY